MSIFVNAEVNTSDVHLDSCVAYQKSMPDNVIKSMVVALYLNKSSSKYIIGEEHLLEGNVDYTITSRSTGIIDKESYKNTTTINMDEIKYECYLKK